MLILFWLAILPSIILARKVLDLDKIEKEPRGLLIRLFVLGMFSCIPAGLIESFGCALIESITSSEAVISALTFLVLVPVAEEGVKYLVLRTTRNNPDFNYTFDAIVYSVMVGLGFATLENILYVLSEGSFGLAIMRGVLSVPMHCTCAVFMGYYYGVRRGLEVRGLNERARTAGRMSFIVPWVLHGFYDFALDTDSWLLLIAMLVLTLVAFATAARQVRFASEHDTPIVAGLRQPDPTTLPHVHEWESKGRPVPPL